MVGWHAQFFGGMEQGRVRLFKKLQSRGICRSVLEILFGLPSRIFCNDVEIANKKTLLHLTVSMEKNCQENSKSRSFKA